MVYRIFVEKKQDLAFETMNLRQELVQFAGLVGLDQVRIINRYDVQGLTEEAFVQAIPTVFSQPQLDCVSRELHLPDDARVFALEYLPGQFDQRADSAAQCLQMQTLGDRPLVRTARVYVLLGNLSSQDLEKAKAYLLNPVESREANFSLPDSLELPVTTPQLPQVLDGFRSLDAQGRQRLLTDLALAMEDDDLQVMMAYFHKEGRDPSLTELKVIDTYWSDHCRHTTFFTHITEVVCEDQVIENTLQQVLKARETLGRNKPLSLMEVGTIAAPLFKHQGGLLELEETEENNACTIRIKAQTQDGEQDWLLFFKNETHNHPTEIEPFGGAATCIGGAIRDPLSARAYVYAGMRVTGGGDPSQPIENTLPGKLPQRRIAQEAAAGFSSYGNQIGVATGAVKEYYHPGFVAKRLEAGAVLAAAPAAHVRREQPAPGDVIILLGGRTGRDGLGGATGSSKAHTVDSVEECAAQVQKGNPPEERKLQRLFVDPKASALIKRCNDFGAGGVSVAIGELADGLLIDLDAVPVKYQGLNATELAISESQERMAVVVEEKDAQTFIDLAAQENLEATVVAVVTADKRLVMRWQGHTVVNIARDFLNSNGAKKQMKVVIPTPHIQQQPQKGSFRENLLALAADLNGCSNKGLVERFDSTIGSATVLMPLGGKHQLTPPCAMVHRLPIKGGTDTASFMAHGYDPCLSQQSPYHGAYYAVVESISRLVAAGAPDEGIYLSFQEYFPKLGRDKRRWGLPLAALLGAFRAQMDVQAAAIGGKDSMSGSFEHLDVPPSLISFAVAAGKAQEAISPEFKKAGSQVILLKPKLGKDGLPEADSLRQVLRTARQLIKNKQALSCQAVGFGGVAYAIMMMALGNGIGFEFGEQMLQDGLFEAGYGSLLVELAPGQTTTGEPLGQTVTQPVVRLGTQSLALADFRKVYEGRLEAVHPQSIEQETQTIPVITSHHRRQKGPRVAKPRVLLPVFPGTNCELDTARAFEEAGALVDIFLVRNRTPQEVAQSIQEAAKRIQSAQMMLIPGGFSGGDEPDGSGKFITAFLRSGPVRDAVQELLYKKGLLGGICNGFQALVKTGLLPNGQFMDMTEHSPTLTQNTIGRHQSRMVHVRVASNLSPWFALYEVGACYALPVSHGEGRFLCSEEQLQALAAKGQIAAQYATPDGQPSMDIRYNPNGSAWAVEALTSLDGLVMGRMGHAERMVEGLYKNLPGVGSDPLFRGAMEYFN